MIETICSPKWRQEEEDIAMAEGVVIQVDLDSPLFLLLCTLQGNVFVTLLSYKN